MTDIRIDLKNDRIVITKKFAKLASRYGSKEYKQLRNARNDYPDFEVVMREIKKNPDKESYKGLTYAYMKDYIRTHEPRETRRKKSDELEELILISQCHSKAFRYPAIKKWFLEQYPEIEEFGMPLSKSEDEEEAETTAFEEQARKAS